MCAEAPGADVGRAVVAVGLAGVRIARVLAKPEDAAVVRAGIAVVALRSLVALDDRARAGRGNDAPRPAAAGVAGAAAGVRTVCAVSSAARSGLTAAARGRTACAFGGELLTSAGGDRNASE